MPKIDPVEAAEPGYVRIDYMPDPNVTITIDGRWTVDNEWTNNGEITWIENKVLFRSVWSFVSMSEVYDTWLVEFFTDNPTILGIIGKCALTETRAGDPLLKLVTIE